MDENSRPSAANAEVNVSDNEKLSASEKRIENVRRNLSHCRTRTRSKNSENNDDPMLFRATENGFSVLVVQSANASELGGVVSIHIAHIVRAAGRHNGGLAWPAIYLEPSISKDVFCRVYGLYDGRNSDLLFFYLQ